MFFPAKAVTVPRVLGTDWDLRRREDEPKPLVDAGCRPDPGPDRPRVGRDHEDGPEVDREMLFGRGPGAGAGTVGADGPARRRAPQLAGAGRAGHDRVSGAGAGPGGAADGRGPQ